MDEVCGHVAALVYPLPQEPEEVDPAESFEDAVAAARQRQRDCADALRAAWEDEGCDPVLGELTRVASAIRRLDALSRALVAYGREFTAPRPYTLASLADAAGLANHSSIRTYYGAAEVNSVAQRTGAKPVRRTKK